VGVRVYRGDWDGRKGLLLFAASPSSMTLVYDTARCGLYQAWRGPVLKPRSPLFHRQEADTLWRVRKAGVNLAVRPRFVGFEEDSTGYLGLHYSLELPGGKSVQVREVPAYDDHYGDMALRQEFRIQGMEEGMRVSVRLGGKAYAWKELWGLSANGELTGAPGAETLETPDDGVSAVKVTFEGSQPGSPAP
jgi:hypothetical protein